MIYRSFLIYFILLTLCATPLWAQDTRYRVEVLVLTHLHHDEPAKESDVLSDYSSSLDFLTPKPEVDEDESAKATAATGNEDQASLLSDTEGSEIPEEPDPNAVVHLEEMSDVMREAWRRLRLSAPFRPQQYLSWEQGNQEPFPALRVHDLEVVMVKDPRARARLKMIEADLLENETEKNERLLAASSPTDPQAEPDPTEAQEEPALPDTAIYYRLDGTVMLRRTRFLHLDFDIQMRSGEWEPEPLQIVSQDPVIFERAGPTAFQLHELKQSRQVKTGRMEYFDGPVLSVLAYITSVKVDREE